MQKMKRFLASETFTDEETGTEYFQGAIYEVDDKTRPSVEQWVAEGKVRDPDQGTTETAEASEPEGEGSDESSDDLTPEEIDAETEQEDEDDAASTADKAKRRRRDEDPA